VRERGQAEAGTAEGHRGDVPGAGRAPDPVDVIEVRAGLVVLNDEAGVPAVELKGIHRLMTQVDQVISPRGVNNPHVGTLQGQRQGVAEAAD
jgi:hypothetical protein